MSYNVYRIASTGLPRDHHAIFVETEKDGTGELLEVAGNIQEGMSFSMMPTKKPEDSITYKAKVLIGKVSEFDYPRMRDVCEMIPPPKKQFQGSRRLFPNEPLRRCQEWTAEAIQALLDAHVIVKVT
ncbi:hypothetical protein L228DRAFT_249908 [Xylona heveae TC161]|uniref:Uncharacterized protein n=1 Tax=Xylona heveae (strain CBS 132557 / TC161) TaxID=1328760 RepID=A0A165ABU4_XYLHT|nr:hypothetical protein L228DRAFT_249908 [Xylona heveae TC161]KZF20227.1 hypothetical protein L228DRAFT_249908 [Xylona heveae TC161]